jgi:hypothetical protein
VKLIYCGKCGGIVSLRAEWSKCPCGQSSGAYFRGAGCDVEVKGPCLVLGIDNNELADAVKRYLLGKDRAGFTGFIFIPQVGKGKFNALPEDLEDDPSPEKAFIRRSYV